MKTRNGVTDVIKRLLEAVDVDSERALSQYFGYGPTMMTSKRQRGNIPFKEAAIVATALNYSLDWLLLGLEPKRRSDIKSNSQRVDVAREGNLQAHQPALFIADTGEDQASWDHRNQQAQELLREVIEGVEAALIDSGFDMSAKRKAELIATLFEIYASAQARPSRSHILRLVRSAS